VSIHIESIAEVTGHSFRLLRWRDNLKDVEQCDGPGQVRRIHGAGERWHLHREMELTWIERGSGLRVVGDNVAPFSAPELVLLGPHLPHCWHGLRRSSGFALQFHWPLEHPLRLLPEFGSLKTLWQRAGRGLLFAPDTVSRVATEMEAMTTASAPVRLGLLLGILGELAAAAPRKARELSQADFSIREGSRHQANIERVIRHVLANFGEPVPLDAVLKLAGMSKATFARQFPRFTGCTFTEFLARIRLDQARQRILAGDESISTIAFAVGFNHLSHFNRAYRKNFRCTPTKDRTAGKPSKNR
jgi:AraC-like DNA-binding protein